MDLGGSTYEVQQVFYSYNRGETAEHYQRRVAKLVVAAAAAAEAKAQAKAEAETRQAAFQASEEARMRVVRRARERTNKARGRFTAYCNRAEDVGSMWETG